MHFLNGKQPAHDLTYNDVFMVPNRSNVTSRFDVDLTTPDAVGTTIPLVVSNMTAVAGRRMAETVARRGGIAILPQDIPLDVVANAVTRVKDAHPVFDTPVTVDPHTTVGEALSLIPKRAHGAAIVVRDGKVVGVMTARDGEGVDRFAQVHEVMTPEVLALPADCADEVSIAGAIDEAAATFGGLDIVVSNAGIELLGEDDRVDRLELSVWRRLLQNNLDG
ncbi:MAG: SDR family NAD(P)-dependent oxidoreductase, partial [Actinomycetia bacterium]|nr:SDR family NAD(P)-dependent oxidoreductase [Actinomycetes bacterium]